MQAPMGKPFKTQGFAHHGTADSSRIRELREDRCWILEGSALPLKALKRYLSMFIDLILDSRVEGGIPSLAAVPEVPVFIAFFHCIEVCF
jgi:hypothetical protein